jgi:hypothetical protein
MPLNSDELDDIDRSADVRLLGLFKRNRALAFELDEIQFEANLLGLELTRSDLQILLNDLVRRRRLALGEKDGRVYYRYDNWVGFRGSKQ